MPVAVMTSPRRTAGGAVAVPDDDAEKAKSRYWEIGSAPQPARVQTAPVTMLVVTALNATLTPTCSVGTTGRPGLNTPTNVTWAGAPWNGPVWNGPDGAASAAAWIVREILRLVDGCAD